MGASCSTDNRAGRPININAPSEIDDEDKTLQKSLVALSRLTVPFPVHPQPPSVDQVLGDSAYEATDSLKVIEKPLKEIISPATDEASFKTKNSDEDVQNEEVNLKRIVQDEVMTHNMPEIEPEEGNFLCGKSIENIQKMNADNLSNRRRSIQVEEFRPDIEEGGNLVLGKSLDPVEKMENENTNDRIKVEEIKPAMAVEEEVLINEGMNGMVKSTGPANIDDLYLPKIEENVADAAGTLTELEEGNEPEKVLEAQPVVEEDSVYETPVVENSVMENSKSNFGENYVKDESPVIDFQYGETQL